MQKRTKILAVSAMLLAALALAASRAYDPEPRYNGQPLHRWVELLPAAEAQSAIEHIRAKAIPFLLRWLADEWQPLKSKEWVAHIAPRFTL